MVLLELTFLLEMTQIEDFYFWGYSKDVANVNIEPTSIDQHGTSKATH